MVIFGAAGDLTRRKLVPALYNLAKDRLLPTGFAVVGVARRPLSTEPGVYRTRTAMRGPFRSPSRLPASRHPA